MSQIFLLIQSLNPCGKMCIWALKIAINMSAAICQLPTCQFSALGKKANTLNGMSTPGHQNRGKKGNILPAPNTFRL